MLGEEVPKTALRVTVYGAQITTGILEAIIKRMGQKTINYGKQSIKSLNRKGKTLDSIPVSSQDIMGLKKEFKKQGVDFSLRKNTSEANIRYDLYFKAQDIGQIESVMKRYTQKSFKSQEKSASKLSINEKLQQAKEKAEKYNEMHQEVKREKVFERGRESR